MLKKIVTGIGLLSFIFMIGCVAATDKTMVKAPSDAKAVSLHEGTRFLAEKLSASLQGKQLDSFAVADLIGPGSGITEFGEQISDDLGVQLFQSINYRDYVERRQLKQLLSTISKEGKPYFDQNTVSKYGKSLGLQDMAIGTIRDLGGYYSVIVKIVHIETAKTLAMAHANLSKTSAVQTLVEKKQTATLTVSVSPAIQGTVTAAGRQYRLNNGSVIINGVPYGDCPIILQPYSGSQAIRRNISIKSPVETLAVTLPKNKYDASFTIIPPDSTLVLDGNEIPLNKNGYAKIDSLMGEKHSLLITCKGEGYNENISKVINLGVKTIYQFELPTPDSINRFSNTLFQKVMKITQNQDFNVKLWTNQSSYKIGDRISFSFNSEKACYLNIVDVGPTGNITLLFPNRHHQDSKISANKTYTIPDETSDSFAFSVDPPAGTERVYAIASTQPLNIFNSNFRGTAYQTITRGKTRDIGVIQAGDTLSNVKLSAASTCVIDVMNRE